MALTDENGGGIPATMLVAPTGNVGGMPYPVYTGGNQGGNGFGDGNSGWWLILLFLLLIAGGGWNNGNGNGGGTVFTGNGGMNLYPWMNQAEITTNGFQNQLMNDNVTSIRDGVSNLSTQLCNCCGDISNQLCNGFAGVNSNISNGFATAEIAANGRQMANMNQAFGAQMAMAQGFNQLGSQFADCCCENRLGIADLKYTVATENCADRAALSDGIQAVIASQTASTQRILDKLCDQELQAERRENANLRSELMYARSQASQVDQTAQILANNNAQTAIFQQGLNNEVDALYNRLSQCPVGTVPVFGNQPIFTCPNNNNNGCGCGCGCNGGFAA